MDTDIGWLFLVLAGLFEMAGVAMINKLHIERDAKAFSLMILGFGLSFAFLSLAMKTLPMGTAYAIWTGIGACGGAVLGMAVYGESRNASRILSIAIVLIAVIGLKMMG